MKTKTLSVRVPVDVAKRLERLARDVDRSASYVAGEAIEDYLTLQEWQVAAIKEGLADLDAGRTHSHEEAMKIISGWKK